MSSLRLEHFNEERNKEGLRLYAETLNEVRDTALACIITQKHAIYPRYNAKVKGRRFQVGDLVLRKVEFLVAKRREGKHGAN